MDASVDVVALGDMWYMCMYMSPPTFLQLHVESSPFALQVGAVGRVGADPALQGGGGGRRGPGHQVVG